MYSLSSTAISCNLYILLFFPICLNISSLLLFLSCSYFPLLIVCSANSSSVIFFLHFNAYFFALLIFIFASRILIYIFSKCFTVSKIFLIFTSFCVAHTMIRRCSSPLSEITIPFYIHHCFALSISKSITWISTTRKYCQ